MSKSTQTSTQAHDAASSQSCQKSVRKRRSAPALATTHVSRERLQNALDGISPKSDARMSLSEFGRALAEHRRGPYAGAPYRRQTVSMYLHEPERQGIEFARAFESWFATMSLSEQEQHERESRIAHELDTSVAALEHVVVVGRIGMGDDVRVLAIGEVADDVLIRVNGTISTVINRAGVRRCACGNAFVVRSWNQRRCEPNCKGLES